MGIELIDHSIFQCLDFSNLAEAALIERCAAEAIQRHKNEWFVGLDYIKVCDWAQFAATTLFEPSTNIVKRIRERLEMSQQELGAAIGCTQGNVGHYERGQMIPPPAAKNLIEVARGRGLVITFDHIYGDAGLPQVLAKAI